MKIVIFAPTSTKLEHDSIHKRPLGGADSCLLKMIQMLGKFHEVHAYGPFKSFEARGLGSNPDILHEINYYPFMDLFSQPVECDILIVYRKIWAIPPTVKYKKLIFYSQDTADTPCFSGSQAGLFSEYINMFDRIIVLSNFHKRNLQDAFNIPKEKFSILGNALDSNDVCYNEGLANIFREKNLGVKDGKITTPRFVYCSTPYRGLVVLMKMWKQIKERLPYAELHVFSSMAIYDGQIHDQMQFQQMYDRLKTMDGVVYHGSEPHWVIMESMLRSCAVLYPNTYPETFCNVIHEARCTRTPFITSMLGALPETGGVSGIYIEGNAYTPEYQQKFIDETVELCNDFSRYKRIQSMPLPVIVDWDDYVDNLLRILVEVQNG